jgi:hypothetical protein
MVEEASHSRLEACFAHVRIIMRRVVLSLAWRESLIASMCCRPPALLNDQM